jgi:hypothetical protein
LGGTAKTRFKDVKKNNLKDFLAELDAKALNTGTRVERRPGVCVLALP